MTSAAVPGEGKPRQKLFLLVYCLPHMPNEKSIYRILQKHLDRQPVGFPATRSNADLKLLERLFAPKEAALALHLSFRPLTMSQIQIQAAPSFSESDVEQLLQSMFQKGSIGRKVHDGVLSWYLLPLVVGMYEGQDGTPSLRFLKDAGEYMQTLAFGKSLLVVRPAQMRTIPVNKAIVAGHAVAPWDRVETLLDQADGPFVILGCICRAANKLKRKKCEKTSRKETCLAMGSMAQMVLDRGHGRKITREEALSILHENEAEGLLFQPSNVQKPEFICSCCGCCCGMLGMQKKLPRPVDFWATNFCLEADAALCKSCGKCIIRCQVDALSLDPKDKTIRVNRNRCIGCGLCVSNCAPQALRLLPKKTQITPPVDEQALLEAIGQNKKGPVGQWLTLLKAALGVRLGP